MYKADKPGGTLGTNGRYYTWTPGEVDAPKGELDHVPGMEWQGDEMTKKEIMNALDEQGVEYDGRSKKSDLLKLLQ